MDVTQLTESSVGPQVPSVIAVNDEGQQLHSDSWSEEKEEEEEEEEDEEHKRCDEDLSATRRKSKVELDKDFLCPICIQTMRDAFLTACGHSFCHVCITTHLGNRSNCPCCGLYLTNDQLFPNFLLNKLMKKASASQLISNAPPTEQLRLALQQGVDLPVKELGLLMQLLGDKKRKAEQEEAETNMEILLEFLLHSRQQKQEELRKLQGDLHFLKEDIETVERQCWELARAKEKYLLENRTSRDSTSSSWDLSASVGNASTQNRGAGAMPGSSQSGISPKHAVGNCEGQSLLLNPTKNELCPVTGSLDHRVSDAQELPDRLTVGKKLQVLAQFEDLQEAYLQRKRHVAQMHRQNHFQQLSQKKLKDEKHAGFQSYRDGLEDFQSVLSAFTRYSRLRVIAELRHGDLFHSSNIVSSIEFDRDDELFATAGVSRRIKVFEFATVVNELADVHCPVVEIPTRSKLSCLSWNKYIKQHIASSDYEGIVTVWDVNSQQSIMEYEEHEKRAWSVDFSRTDPTMLVSGSDDGKVKVWCTRQEMSALNIDMKANICCVKYNPGSSNFVAVGSADHHIHYYDLRRPNIPLHVFKGHQKAVSYVKFISPNELASASTDSTLRLWDVQENSSVRTLQGHTNEKNFVGLTVNNEYIACGSETNEVFVYHKAISKPASRHRFGSSNPEESDDDVSPHFISAVCWKSESPTMLAANSQGTIKVLVLAP
ncbi:unnamed protein product [Sphagnum jensenii]|uniref:RING-type domain-containing protein n=1 Tax=Sphagnum jensenii TaxID=128206 RepID=A0ABP0VZF6_9BRYO